MKLPVDSDGLIEVALNWLKRKTVIVCSPVTVAELWHGASSSERKVLNDLFGSRFCVPLVGDFLRQYRKSHHLELGDAIIAVTTSVHDTPLWTRNRKYYPLKELVFY